MNKIHRKVEYALMALKHMRAKAPGALTSVKEISALYGCPFDATSRVLQTLAQRGILKSEQGAHGGYQLIRDLNRISFFEILEMILGPMAVAKCMHEAEREGDVNCEIRGTCNIVTPVQNLNRKLNDFYKSLTMAELLDPRSQGAGRADVMGLAAQAAAAIEAQAAAVVGAQTTGNVSHLGGQANV